MPRAFSFDEWKKLWRGELSEARLFLLNIINNHPEVSKKEMADVLAISTTAIDKHLLFLRQLNLIDRIGPDKGGRWRINFISP